MSNNHHRRFGETGILLPPIAFRADVLDDPTRVLPEKSRRLICAEWFKRIAPPVFIEVVVNENGNRKPNTIGQLLRQFDVSPNEVVINLEIEARGDLPIGTHLGKTCTLLGKSYLPRLVTLRVPAEHEPASERAFDAALRNAADSLHELSAWKSRFALAGVGIAVHDWRIGQKLRDAAGVDFIKLLTGPTVLRHSAEMLTWLADLAGERAPVITAGVFHGGFLVGGPMCDYCGVTSNHLADQAVIAWRKSFAALCHGHGVRPYHACLQFALGIPGIAAASLRTSNADRVVEVVHAASTPVPAGLWASMKEEGLLEYDHADDST